MHVGSHTDQAGYELLAAASCGTCVAPRVVYVSTPLGYVDGAIIVAQKYIHVQTAATVDTIPNSYVSEVLIPCASLALMVFQRSFSSAQLPALTWMLP